MRKFFILFVMCYGLMSVADTATFKSIDSNLLSNDLSGELVFGHSLSEQWLYECTITITDTNGNPLNEVTAIGLNEADACLNAQRLARLWIASN